ncbi:MAG TPA: hypothetical protein VIL33_07540, partial [Rhodothermia bacterium]
MADGRPSADLAGSLPRQLAGGLPGEAERGEAKTGSCDSSVDGKLSGPKRSRVIPDLTQDPEA